MYDHILNLRNPESNIINYGNFFGQGKNGQIYGHGWNSSITGIERTIMRRGF